MRRIARYIYIMNIRIRKKILNKFYRIFIQSRDEIHFPYYGFRVKQHPTDPYWAGRFSGDLKVFAVYVDAINRFCPANPVIIDVGANIGLATIAFSQVPGARVESFEPVRRSFGYLEANIRENGLTNVRAHNIGLSDKPCDLLIGAIDDQTDSGSFRVLNTPANGYVETAHFETFDSVAEKLGLTRVDYIKIDAEGHDALVLAGCSKTIEKYRPVVQVEVSTNLNQKDKENKSFFKEFIRAGSYEAYHIYRSVIPISDLDLFFAQDIIQNDIVLVPRQRR